MTRISTIEPLESRIAPAILIANPIFDQTATSGQTGTSIDLGKLVDATKSYRTVVDLDVKYLTETGTISIELFDDKAPLTVANFVRTVNNPNKAADYDGVLFNRFVSGFVLQGGGFNAATPTQHNTTFATLHNEYDPADFERSNLIQTVAMAKVGPDNGGGPHSATDEFFINLGDNSGNLNSQNDGFTVFGRVTDASFSVVNAITALPTAQAQQTQITDAHIAPSAPGDALGFGFSVVSVKDATTLLDSKLVTYTLNPATHQLDLKYSTTMTGVARVTVKISKVGEADVFDDFLVTVKPNLITNIVTDGLPGIFVPGDSGTAKVKLTNTAGGVANGKVSVKLFLSESNGTGTDLDGFTLVQDGANPDIFLGSADNVSIHIANGKAITLPVKFSVPSTGLTVGKSYRVLAKIETPAGTTIQELFSDDNVGNQQSGPSTAIHAFRSAFGAVGDRAHIPLTIEDTNGDPITFLLTGNGTGIVVQNPTDGSLDVTLSGTDAKSKLTIKTARGVIADLDDLIIPNTIGRVSLANVHLHGNFAASGGAKSIVLGDLGNTDDAHPEDDAEKTFDVGTFPSLAQKLSLKLGKVRDYTLHSDTLVGSLTAKEWLNNVTNAPNTISATGINLLKIAGDLEANISTLGDGKMSLLSVGGALSGATVKTGGDIANVKLGSISGSNFLAGLSAKPASLTDLAPGKTISKFTVAGAFSDSTVAAKKFGAISIGSVDAIAGSEGGGFYADAIKSYLRKTLPPVKLTGLDATGAFDVLSPNYHLQLF